ncbi:MAG: LysR family transcriptional regulator [Opitutaceae bacterium]|nr:LysR family transcriptional regulator [Opitutaceae bacterium]
MEIHQLRYFIAIVDTGTFTRAAEKCHVAQPSLSQQIIKLEDELGQKLFHRLGRRVELTGAGEFFVGKARGILLEIENTQHELDDAVEEGAGKVSIGAIPTVAPYLLPQILLECQVRYPDLKIEVREDFHSDIAAAVIEGEVDVAIVSNLSEDERLVHEPLLSEPLVLVLPSGHWLSKKEKVYIDDLQDESFILLGEASSLASKVRRFFGDNNFEPTIVARCSQMKTVKSLVASGLGISIIPRMTVESGDEGFLVFRSLSDVHLVRDLVMIRDQRRYLNRSVKQFMDLLLKKCQNLESF